MAENEQQSRDEQFWAKPVTGLHVGHELPPEAVNLNLEGRRVAGVSGGFGKMWQKTYEITLSGADASPERVVKTWREHFREFWPKNVHFFGPGGEVKPGDVVPLNLGMPAGVKLMTGILVVYADERSFSFVNPEGHMFSGMITFSAHEKAGETVAQVQALIRAQDPLYEMAMMLGGHRKEDRQWEHTLRALARRFGVEATPVSKRVCVDNRRQWDQFGNIRRSAVFRSGLYWLGAPVRAIKKPFKRQRAA